MIAQAEARVRAAQEEAAAAVAEAHRSVAEAMTQCLPHALVWSRRLKHE